MGFSFIASSSQKLKPPSNPGQFRLNALGIGIDDAVNGIGLPRDFHQSLHTDDYYRAVNEASRNWTTPEQAVNGLQDLANTLRQQSQ
ncbi:AHH domain-containing protein [Methylomicrobium sp. RS1]|jgi:hypothetical protein|uniref:AHH domain-containing protein n=1 Tax=Candidatus Methylomicrobium oryzae TaxID=2802053 RepID=UPI0019213337|nr:AHH domain-containing protein [Methylomicrobium sp. RS1]MBL1265627.1 AHH domain-containing protein [Methylomicrobium sp. RS1]